mmetsp:Transcript_2421/g.4870  ORF Transcript_2421/g.4870 Transcript_2421/m.4870 type:complete len:160 (+) Transcript_2421:341-820(+)
MFDLIFWVGLFLVEAGLLGMIMFTLICLMDLESDFINPHDATGRINKLLLPERLLQGVHTIVLLVRGEFLVSIPNLALAAFLVYQIVKRNALLDVTEIFTQLPWEKRVRLCKLAVHFVSLIYVIYRLVEAGVSVLMDHHGHTITKHIMNNVASAGSRTH